MISKELLREVLTIDYAFNIQPVKEWQTNTLEWYRTEIYKEQIHSINIYELAHECKEWAFDKGYSISVWKERVFGYYSENTRKFVTFNYTGEILSNNVDIKDINFTYKFETEEEYIFKACQWILDNEDN